MKHTQNDDGHFLDRSKSFWQSRTTRQLCHEDARQMVGNVSGFFRVLNEWATREACPLENGSEVTRDR